ncbi:hypothetical protein BAUCODRAFT_21881 [Baudoinia panamericana UAMH 10762]|uniref:Uncharacterized protein n=1 Tax=Baudoinia panamericana (strain UAMH 10762) TaxID=717646 RepID=M2LZV2_BAUPA|nr:uncharacterized protein BAUCODRAFT_21881 [Baudoinia panamericana UAMH 10762]EMD00248.1 hypothetical protein BAUCODRAFT_21881 [Baudoinia panamericana UAMH 10762]
MQILSMASSETVGTVIMQSPLSTQPQRTPDIDCDPVAIFPLINCSYAAARVGIKLGRRDAFAVLLSTPGVTVTAADQIGWDNAVWWLDERSLHTMTTSDVTAYGALIQHQDDDTNGRVWHTTLTPHLQAQHQRVFHELGLDTKSASERKFQRLDAPLTSQVKTALRELEGVYNLPMSALNTPDRVKKRMFDGWDVPHFTDSLPTWTKSAEPLPLVPVPEDTLPNKANSDTYSGC